MSDWVLEEALYIVLHGKKVLIKATLLWLSFSKRIKTYDSDSRGQEEAGCTGTQRMSVLFTHSTTVKFLNTLNKPPLKLLLSYQGLSTF